MGGMTLSNRLLLVATTAILTAACSATEPSVPTAGTQLRALKYIRTRPVITSAANAQVVLHYSWPHIDDPHHRHDMGSVPLRAVDATMFVYDYPNIFYVPVDSECLFWITDPGVSRYHVATDIYVNDILIRVEVVAGTNDEHGHFRVSRKTGRVF